MYIHLINGIIKWKLFEYYYLENKIFVTLLFILIKLLLEHRLFQLYIADIIIAFRLNNVNQSGRTRFFCKSFTIIHSCKETFNAIFNFVSQRDLSPNKVQREEWRILFTPVLRQLMKNISRLKDPFLPWSFEAF